MLLSPLPHIRWRKLDADLPPNYEVSMNGALLHLINVQYEDEGSYECEALNVKGMDWYRQWLYVEGEDSLVSLRIVLLKGIICMSERQGRSCFLLYFDFLTRCPRVGGSYQRHRKRCWQ